MTTGGYKKEPGECFCGGCRKIDKEASLRLQIGKENAVRDEGRRERKKGKKVKKERRREEGKEREEGRRKRKKGKEVE